MCIHGFAFCWKRVKSICILSKARTLMLLNIATDCTLVPDSACQTVSMVEKKYIATSCDSHTTFAHIIIIEAKNCHIFLNK